MSQLAVVTETALSRNKKLPNWPFLFLKVKFRTWCWAVSGAYILTHECTVMYRTWCPAVSGAYILTHNCIVTYRTWGWAVSGPHILSCRWLWSPIGHDAEQSRVLTQSLRTRCWPVSEARLNTMRIVTEGNTKQWTLETTIKRTDGLFLCPERHGMSRPCSSAFRSWLPIPTAICQTPWHSCACSQICPQFISVHGQGKILPCLGKYHISCHAMPAWCCLLGLYSSQLCCRSLQYISLIACIIRHLPAGD